MAFDTKLLHRTLRPSLVAKTVSVSPSLVAVSVTGQAVRGIPTVASS